MVSGDGAETWMPAFNVRQPATMVQAAPDGTIYAFVVGTGLIRTKEPGLIWEPVTSHFGPRVLLPLERDPHQPTQVHAVAQDVDFPPSPYIERTWTDLGFV